jgi:hypothetical protein
LARWRATNCAKPACEKRLCGMFVLFASPNYKKFEVGMWVSSYLQVEGGMRRRGLDTGSQCFHARPAAMRVLLRLTPAGAAPAWDTRKVRKCALHQRTT